MIITTLFLAMQAVLDPPPGGWEGIPPPYGFALVMLGWCVLLNGVGIGKLRQVFADSRRCLHASAHGV